jgi:hypothetical protein
MLEVSSSRAFFAVAFEDTNGGDTVAKPGIAPPNNMTNDNTADIDFISPSTIIVAFLLAVLTGVKDWP